LIGGLKMSGYAPLLIARQKDAKFCKDDYKLGWLYSDNTGYYWSVWGSTTTIENALKIAKENVENTASRKIYLSEIPIEKGVVVHDDIPEFKELTL
jgi:hypothetical protein